MTKHLRLTDFRDIDLIALAAEQADEVGTFTTADLGAALGFGEELRSVGIRLSWMRRFGAFSFDEERRLWRFTRAGERVLAAEELDLADDEELDELPDAAFIKHMAYVRRRQRRTRNTLEGTLLRREFILGTHPGSVADSRNGRRRG